MKKEMIIVTIILIATIVLDLITQTYLNNVVRNMNSQIEDISTLAEEDLKSNSNNNNNEIEERATKLSNNWNSFNKKLAYYIEHDEIEKVDTSIVTLKEDLNLNEYDEAIPEMKKCQFLLDHIRDKEALSIINLF